MAYRKDGLAPAIVWGGLATGACYTIGTLWLAATGGWWEMVPVALFAGFNAWFIGTGIVAIGMLVIGLPFTFVMRELDCEDPLVYGLAGAIAGFLIPGLPVLLSVGTIGEETLFFAIPGLVAGGTAAFVWGRWCERVAGETDDVREPIAHDRGERWLR